MKLDKFSLGKIIRLTTGHNNLNYHLSKQIPIHNEICRFCLEKSETFQHFLTDCPRFAERRASILLAITPPILIEINLEKLLEFSEHPDIEDAMIFEDN